MSADSGGLRGKLRVEAAAPLAWQPLLLHSLLAGTEQQRRGARLLRQPESTAVAQFLLAPKGWHTLQLLAATPCLEAASPAVLDKLVGILLDLHWDEKPAAFASPDGRNCLFLPLSRPHTLFSRLGTLADGRDDPEECRTEREQSPAFECVQLGGRHICSGT